MQYAIDYHSGVENAWSVGAAAASVVSFARASGSVRRVATDHTGMGATGPTRPRSF